MCRILILVGDSHYIKLAGPALEQLSYTASADNQSPRFSNAIWATIDSLTRLTRLQLHGFGRDDNLRRLRNKELVELILINCHRLETLLFVEGAFTRLERLCMHESCFHLIFLPGADEHEAYKQLLEKDICDNQIDRVAKVVQSLPRLVQIRGGCDLFTIGMREILKGWKHKSSSSTRCSGGRNCPSHHSNVWSR